MCYENKLLFDFDSHLPFYLIAVSFDKLILPESSEILFYPSEFRHSVINKVHKTTTL